jgi:hypothetical protein
MHIPIPIRISIFMNFIDSHNIEVHTVVMTLGLNCYLQEYSALFEGAGNNPGEKTLEDKFFEHEVSVNDCMN